jgi:hypothetical protein
MLRLNFQLRIITRDGVTEDEFEKVTLPAPAEAFNLADEYSIPL